MDGVRIDEKNGGYEDEMNNATEDASDESVTIPENLKSAPCRGMEFNSYDKAYAFYNNYAKEAGFGSRVLNSYKRKGSEEKCGAVLCYSRQGYKMEKESVKSRPGKICGSPEMVRVHLVESQKWEITIVVLDHNHLTTLLSARFFTPHRNIDSKTKRKIELHCDAGIRTNKSFQALVVEGGGHENLNFEEKDVRNHVTKYKRLKLQEGDGQVLFNYFSTMQLKNSNFYCVLDLDDKQKLHNIFWAAARSGDAYRYFGDVVTFDTTYLTNKYDMPFAPFVGVNHHGQSVLLGCGLLADETTSSFIWLFKAWLDCMSGNGAQAIITDQCKAMQNAISEVFPFARHRLCFWHIMQKLPQKLGGHLQYEDIKLAIERAVYDSLHVSDFEYCLEGAD